MQGETVKNVVKVQVSFKSDNNNEYFTWRPVCTVMIISLSIRLTMRNVSDIFLDKIKKKHILCSIIFFFENRAV